MIIIGLVSILFFYSGFPALLGSVAFVNRFNKNSNVSNIHKPKQDSIIQLKIDPIRSATNEAQIWISGSTENIEEVDVYLNDELVSEIEPVNTLFSTLVTDMSPGENTLFFIGKNLKNSEQRKSSTYTVRYKQKELSLTIDSPSNETVTDKTPIYLVGSTDSDASLYVNTAPAVVGISGAFHIPLNLKEGENTFSIMAQDTAGNEVNKTLHVVYRR